MNGVKMPLTRLDEVNYTIYEFMDAGDRAMVDATLNEVRKVLENWGDAPAKDDDWTKVLLGAIARYVVESRK
jgi:hypothetical protein